MPWRPDPNQAPPRLSGTGYPATQTAFTGEWSWHEVSIAFMTQAPGLRVRLPRSSAINFLANLTR